MSSILNWLTLLDLKEKKFEDSTTLISRILDRANELYSVLHFPDHLTKDPGDFFQQNCQDLKTSFVNLRISKCLNHYDIWSPILSPKIGLSIQQRLTSRNSNLANLIVHLTFMNGVAKILEIFRMQLPDLGPSMSSWVLYIDLTSLRSYSSKTGLRQWPAS